MKQITKKDNQLRIIKNKGLLKLIKSEGITRVNPEALDSLGKKIQEDTQNFIKKLKQHLQINARKTLKKQDILNITS